MDASGVEENYHAAELYYLHDLPWRASFDNGMAIKTRADIGLGYLYADKHGGGWFAVGADVVLELMAGLLELEAGFRPTWLPDHRFGDDDFGGAIQFTSHAGATLNFGAATVGYRFQHCSNAGIYDDNPGLDLHLLGVGVRF